MRRPTRRFQARTSRRRPYLGTWKSGAGTTRGRGGRSLSRRDSIRDSIRDPGRDLIRGSTRGSTRGSIRGSIRDLTRDLTRDSTRDPVRISRIYFRFHHWYRGLTWPTRIGIIFGMVFAAMTLLPVAVAAAIHRGFTYAGTNASQWTESRDAHQSITVYREATQSTQTMQLNTYVLDAMAAQVDPNAPMSALQATAVAVRTFALHSQQTHAASAYGADVTDNSSADLPLWDTTQQKQSYGAAYAGDVARLQAAVTSTDAITMRISGQPILAFITALSAGKTRDGAKELPSHPKYLPSTVCAADAKAANDRQDFRIPKAKLAAELKIPASQFKLSSLKPVDVDAAGYAGDVTDGVNKWTASSFAAALQLPSTHMKFRVSGSVLEIETEGIGSGYGMSLNQAVVDAKRGDDWQTILHHFYPGVAFTKGQ